MLYNNISKSFNTLLKSFNYKKYMYYCLPILDNNTKIIKHFDNKSFKNEYKNNSTNESFIDYKYINIYKQTTNENFNITLNSLDQLKTINQNMKFIIDIEPNIDSLNIDISLFNELLTHIKNNKLNLVGLKFTNIKIEDIYKYINFTKTKINFEDINIYIKPKKLDSHYLNSIIKILNYNNNLKNFYIIIDNTPLIEIIFYSSLSIFIIVSIGIVSIYCIGIVAFIIIFMIKS
jgi:hypothetical protein